MTHLFDFSEEQPRPRARHTDPATSHRAAREHAPKAATNSTAVLRALFGWPNSTYTELSTRTQPRLEAIEVQRRLSDLKGAGLVYVSGLDKEHRRSTYALTDRGRIAALRGTR